MSKGFLKEWEEEERSIMAPQHASAQKQAIALRVNRAQNMLTSSNASGVLGGLTPQNIASAQSSLNAIYREEAIKNKGVIGEFRIEQVHGGFIVYMSREPYGPGDRHIAITLEDVSRIMMAQMASNMMENT
jgi:hypothetical protein